MASREQSARLEQRTLTLSLAAVAALSLGSLAWSLAIESDVVILNGIFNIVVGPRFELQTVAAQDGLRERIWAAVGRPVQEAWLTISITADPRWA